MKRRSKVGGKRANAKDRKSVKRATKLGEPVSSRVPLCERPAESLLQLLKADHEQARACNRIARLGPDRGEGARFMADRGKQAAASDMPSRRRAHRPANAFAATAIGHFPRITKYLAAHHGKPTPMHLPYVMDVWDAAES